MSERKNSLLYGSCIRKCGRDTCKEDGICPVCWAWESAMSKGKEFPPRVKLALENAAMGKAMWPFVNWVAGHGFTPEITNGREEDNFDYLSSAEHSHLLAEARREGRQQAFLEATDAIMKLPQRKCVELFIEERRKAAKAAEGASE